MKKRKSCFPASRMLSVLLCLTLLLASFVMPTSAGDSEQTGEVRFAVVNGIYYVSETNRGGYNEAFLLDAAANGYQYAQIDGLLDSAFAALKEKVEKENLQYILVNGGLTYSGEYENHVALAEKLKQLEAETGVQVIVAAGSQDVNNANASSFASGERKYVIPATARQFSTIYADLGYDLAVSRYSGSTQTTAGLSYSVELDGGYRLIVIDASNYVYQNGYTNVSGMMNENLLNWIKKECAAAEEKGQTVIGMCPWTLSGGLLTDSDAMLTNADEVIDALADAGMNYVLTSGSAKNDIAALVSDNGNVLYEVQSADLVSFPNTFRVASFGKNGGTFDIADVDCVKPVVSHDGETYAQPYRETASLKIQYADYDLAKYCANIIKNYVGSILIPGVKNSGTLESFVKSKYGVSLTDVINSYIGGGLNILDTIIIFDASNIVNMLEDMFQQAQSGFLEDDDTLADLCYVRLQAVFDAEISSVPCTAFLATYGFGNAEQGGTLGDLLLSVIAYSRYGNEDSSQDAFINDVLKNLNSGELVPFLATVLGQTLIKDLLFGDILSQIEMRPQYLLFLDDSEGSLGSYLQIAFRFYLAVHGESANVTGAVNSILKDGFFKEYGRSLEEVIDYFIDLYYSGDDKVVTGKQLATILSSYVSDSDPQEHGDWNVTYDGSKGAAAYATKANYRLPTMLNITPGNDTTTEAYVTWYTKSTVTGSDIEIYSDKNSTFYGKHFIGVDGVSTVSETEQIDRTYYQLDLGFASFFETDVSLVKHTLKIKGLEPGCTYFFRVGDSAKGWWSETATVTTAEDSENLTFIHVSDTQGRTQEDFSVFANILDCADELYPDSDFILHTGNYVDEPSDLNQWQMLLDGNSETFLSEYIVPVAGSSDSLESVKQNFAIGSLLGASEKTGVYYSFDYNIAHFVILDSGDVKEDGTLSDEQLVWFRNDMSETDAKWKIVAIAEPIYTNGASATDDNHAAYRNQLVSLMDEFDVDVVFSGNDGVYYRTDAMRDGKVTDSPKRSMYHQINSDVLYNTITDPSGTMYSALASSGVHAFDDHEINNVSKEFEQSGVNQNPEVPMFTAVEIYGDTLYLTTCTLDGNRVKRIDRISIMKGATLLGDMDFDGKISASDARTILRAAAGLELLTKAQHEIADLNGDSRITPADARIALRIAAGLE